MSTKSCDRMYGAEVRISAQRAAAARKEADKLACEAWNKRMLGFRGPAQPSPTLGDALNAGFGFLEVRCLGCKTHQTIALDIIRRPKTTPIHELERYMRCKDCSQLQGYPTSAAILSHCGRPRFRPAIRRRSGGRANGNPAAYRFECTTLCFDAAAPRDWLGIGTERPGKRATIE
jgi:ribosomal protein S27E